MLFALQFSGPIDFLKMFCLSLRAVVVCSAVILTYRFSQNIKFGFRFHNQSEQYSSRLGTNATKFLQPYFQLGRAANYFLHMASANQYLSYTRPISYTKPMALVRAEYTNTDSLEYPYLTYFICSNTSWINFRTYCVMCRFWISTLLCLDFSTGRSSTYTVAMLISNFNYQQGLT